MVDLIDHDTFVAEIQKDVVEAVKEYGWTLCSKSCWQFGLSITFIRKVYNWQPRRGDKGQIVDSFNLAKLLDAHRWAKDAMAKAPKNNRLPY